MTRAAEDAAALREDGAGAIMVENFFDAPFAKTDLSPAHDRCAARAVPGMPLLIGSGFRPDSASALLGAGTTGAIARHQFEGCEANRHARRCRACAGMAGSDGCRLTGLIGLSQKSRP